MPSAVSPIPANYRAVTPYLLVRGADAAIAFYRTAFGAAENYRHSTSDGRVTHAEIRIRDSVLMLADEVPEMGWVGPLALGGSPVSLLLYVENVDEVVARAVAAGATLERPVADQFYGDRTGGIRDPFGHRWYIATHIEDVPPGELEMRAKAARG